MSWQRELDVAVAAATQAGALINLHAGRLSAAAVRTKGHSSDLLTFVDEESQRLIIEAIHGAFPADAVLAEEDGLHDTKTEHRRWIIDPIDGTTNFAHGLPPHAVSIGLQAEAEIVVGVVLNVPTGELFTATKGGGTFCNGRRCQVSGIATLTESLITTGLPYRDFSWLEDYLTVLKQLMANTQGVRRLGSAAVDLAYVASGRFECFFEPGLSAWDVAAGKLLVEEAGGRVTDFSDNPAAALFGRQLLASNGALHPALVEVMQPLRHAAR